MVKSLTPKATKSVKTNSQSLQEVGTKRKLSGLQSFSMLVPEDEKFTFADHPGEVFYIVKLEQKFSNLYGNGYIVHVKDMPNAKDTMTAGVFGSIPGKQLDTLWQATLDGTRISLSSPIPVKIEEVPTSKGMSYKFVDPFAK